ncbi:adenosine deaminase [Acidimicrobiia bacterium]|nr:adenosine deaminase [Acidimicrobiia bacterium]
MKDWIQSAPKAVLHDHLDGGLRVNTLIELAELQGYKNLPSSDKSELLKWIEPKPNKSLAINLEAWDHTIAVMQDADSIYRVTMEALEDLANDGVIYAELRFAPLVHCENGLFPNQVVDAVLNGIKDGTERYDILSGAILCAMRHLNNSKNVVKLCIDNPDVLAFDLAGPEVGFSALNHQDAIEIAYQNKINITLHADWEVPEGIHEVILELKSNRIGHGSQIVNDYKYTSDGIKFKNLAAKFVHENNIPLELCPTSNMQCGSCNSISEHPFKKLYDDGFNVTINTDNRLMSNITMSQEVSNLVESFTFTQDEILQITKNTIEAGFVDSKKREKLLSSF